MRLFCECPDWAPNIAKVDGAFLFAAGRLGFAGSGDYDAAPFRYCPWCGAGLKEAVILKERASRGAPTPALTVERLAALLKLLAHTAELPARTYEAEAAWLLPRLRPGAPTPAMIAAAARSIAQDFAIFTERGVRITDERIAANALRAASAAAELP